MHKGKWETQSSAILLKQSLQLPFVKCVLWPSQTGLGLHCCADAWQETLPLQKDLSSSSAGRERTALSVPLHWLKCEGQKCPISWLRSSRQLSADTSLEPKHFYFKATGGQAIKHALFCTSSSVLPSSTVLCIHCRGFNSKRQKNAIMMRNARCKWHLPAYSV